MADNQQSSAPDGSAVSQTQYPSTQTRAAFYDENVQDISTEARNLLTKYSGYPDSEVLQHVLKLVSSVFS